MNFIAHRYLQRAQLFFLFLTNFNNLYFKIYNNLFFLQYNWYIVSLTHFILLWNKLTPYTKTFIHFWEIEHKKCSDLLNHLSFLSQMPGLSHCTILLFMIRWYQYHNRNWNLSLHIVTTCYTSLCLHFILVWNICVFNKWQ